MNKIGSEDVLSEELNRAKTYDECMGIFKLSSLDSDLEEKSLRKALLLADDYEKCIDIHKLAKSGGHAILAERSLKKALQKARTPHECIIVASKTPLGDVLREKARKKIKRLRRSRSDVKKKKRRYGKRG